MPCGGGLVEQLIFELFVEKGSFAKGPHAPSKIFIGVAGWTGLRPVWGAGARSGAFFGKHTVSA